MNNYVLKANNRKKTSGVTLQAKIVSPDKKDYIYRQYPIQLQVQKLTDKECVIRDKQQIESILNSANDNKTTRFWTQITDEVMSLDTALNSASNGSSVTYDDDFGGKYFSPDGDGIQTMIDQTGKVLNRPKYDPSKTENYFMTELRIYIYKGEEHLTYTQNVLIPGYTADEILDMLQNLCYDDIMWNIVKKDNDAYYITGPLNKPTPESIAQQIGLSEYLNIEYCPTYSMYFPQYYINDGAQILSTTSGSSTIAYSMPTASAMIEYASEHPTEVNISDLKVEQNASPSTIQAMKKTIQNVVTTGSPLYDEQYPLTPTGMTIAKTMWSKTVSNSIEYTWSAEGMEKGTVVTKTPATRFVSSAITMSDIQTNITSSSKFSWFVPSDALASYGIVNNNKLFTGSAISINVPSGQNAVIKIVKTLNDLIQSEGEGYAANIVDTTGIGYYKNPSSTSGFTDAMFQYSIKLSGTNVVGYLVSGSVTATTPSNAIDTTNPITNDVAVYTNQISDFNYLVIKSDDLANAVDVKVSVTIKLLRNEISNTATDIGAVINFGVGNN